MYVFEAKVIWKLKIKYQVNKKVLCQEMYLFVFFSKSAQRQAMFKAKVKKKVAKLLMFTYTFC